MKVCLYICAVVVSAAVFVNLIYIYIYKCMGAWYMYYEKNILCLFYSGDETMDIGSVKTCVLWRGNKGIFPLLLRGKIGFFYPKNERGSLYAQPEKSRNFSISLESSPPRASIISGRPSTSSPQPWVFLLPLALKLSLFFLLYLLPITISLSSRNTLSLLNSVSHDHGHRSFID